MKIKTKKQLNLPQLIEYAWDNDIKNEIFIADKQLTNIKFDDTGDVLIYGKGNIKNVKFSIEVEEEITEDTVIPKMLEKSFDAYQNVVLDIQVNQSINTVKENAEVLTLHVINDDDTHTLIWRNGKLVD